MQCPFCLEDDFDDIGLKNHLQYGHCDTYNAVESLTKPLRADN